jgi:hypothetical protein
LPNIVYHPRSSLIYRILLPSNPPLAIPPLDPSTRLSLSGELTTYVEACVERGLISEAAYVTDVRRRVRKAPPATDTVRQLKHASEELTAAEAELQVQNDLFVLFRSNTQLGHSD